MKLLTRQHFLPLALAPCLALLGGCIAGMDRWNRGDISGVITDSLCTPIGGVALRLQGRGPERKTISREDGTFHIAAVPAGIYTIHLTAPEYRSRTMRRVEIIAGRTVSLETALAEALPLPHIFTARYLPSSAPMEHAASPLPAGSLAVTVTDTSGRSIRGAMIRILHTSPIRAGITRADGGSTITAIPSGIRDIHISSWEYYNSVVAGIVINGDSTSSLHVRLTPKSKEDIELERYTDCNPVVLRERFGTTQARWFDKNGTPR